MTKPGERARQRSLDGPVAETIAAPDLPYLPHDPCDYRPGIGLIGCGNITLEHLAAYRRAGYRVLGLCDLERELAEARRRKFFPDAAVYTDFRQLLERDDIEVVDITTHPPQRPPLIEAAIAAGKHVLSQKPFVLDLDQGIRLADLADRQGVLLAVNQNGRWAPHFSYLRHAVARDLIGPITAAHFAVHWDHSWVQGTEFENVRHLILYDFAIHWFDMLTCLMDAAGRHAPADATDPHLSGRPERVYASFVRSPSQKVKPALFGQAMVEYPGAQATLVFDGETKYAPLDNTYVVGTSGTITSQGPDIHTQQVTLTTAAGTARPTLHGDWFPDGFHGTMGELLTAIEQHRQPTHSARNNLASLELCFAAVASAERHEAVVPGTVRQMPR
jgi:predicted dehydrogenase